MFCFSTKLYSIALQLVSAGFNRTACGRDKSSEFVLISARQMMVYCAVGIEAFKLYSILILMPYSARGTFGFFLASELLRHDLCLFFFGF